MCNRTRSFWLLRVVPVGGQAAQHSVGEVRRSGHVLSVLPVRDLGARSRGAGQALSVTGQRCPAAVPLLHAGARQPDQQSAAD